MPLKPSVSDVHAMLRRFNGLIVHFSGSPPGSSFATNPGYPQDLYDVIAGKAQTGLACSVVLPTDNFHSPGVRNAFGCIGVIVRPSGPGSLMAVDPSDAGSFNVGNVRQYPDRDITPEDLHATILHRTEHNEWGLRDYEVIGILAASPFEVWNHTPPGFPAATSIQKVQTEFAGQVVYSFYRGHIISSAGVIDAGFFYP